ncbi:MBL fold metallo-hydrolase [Streptomyces iranensis]|uniref:MBL fold metallo-hydrolase n=2 Tax=Streptomyces iranensis TaxID=576784 RepID=UPI0027E27D5B|nr:MBL fold metallo-hydrolase [Streptomyces iranensis]
MSMDGNRVSGTGRPLKGGRPRLTRVRPGLWSLPIPLPGPLGHVLVYVLETDAGPYLVDAGWDTEEGWSALTAGLRALGTRVEDVRGVLVTHSHLDHYGLAPRIREVSGAWVSLHALDAAGLAQFRADPASLSAALLRRAGAPEAEVRKALDDIGTRSGQDAAPPDRHLTDRERPDVPGWDLTTLWTPGHTPGHLCFWEPRHRLLLTGDHLLPRTTVGMHQPRDETDDPLGDYLETLEPLVRMEPDLVLPAHEYRYTDIAARVGEVRDHHAARTALAVSVLREGPVTAWQLAGRLRRSGSLEGLRGFPLRATVSRALVTLAHLRRLGAAREVPGPPPYWTATARLQRCPGVFPG